MPQRLKVLELLTTKEVEALETFCRERARTIDQIHEFLLAEGFQLSRKAAASWKTHFDGQLMQERFSRSGELAQAIKGAVEKGSFDDVAQAAVMQLTQVVFEQSSMLQADGEIDPLDVQRMSKSLNNLVGSKTQLTKLLFAKFEREMSQQLGASKERTLTAEQIEAAGKAIFGS